MVESISEAAGLRQVVSVKIYYMVQPQGNSCGLRVHRNTHNADSFWHKKAQIQMWRSSFTLEPSVRYSVCAVQHAALSRWPHVPCCCSCTAASSVSCRWWWEACCSLSLPTPGSSICRSLERREEELFRWKYQSDVHIVTPLLWAFFFYRDVRGLENICLLCTCDAVFTLMRKKRFFHNFYFASRRILKGSGWGSAANLLANCNMQNI